ncbi:hypothetical protein [Brevibacillus fulvus]|uniref:Spore protein n=1 Tax=Brevibacillus fulvus TaxID=1125967 RepID=A0A939BST3_9BACL|nr:hypothetical protein [Brevibacillus fulvus]MBM7590808.1 hypothetical protein [Brevibacillus fulvus]
MDYGKERVSNNQNVRDEAKNHQPKSVQNDAPGAGNKKLEGPNRPST